MKIDNCNAEYMHNSFYFSHCDNNFEQLATLHCSIHVPTFRSLKIPGRKTVLAEQFDGFGLREFDVGVLMVYIARE